MANVTPYALSSRALVNVGGRPITSFEDGTAESIAAGREYELAVEECLAAFPWKFARQLATLDKMAEAPEGRWDTFYELPGECIYLRAVLGADGEAPIQYDRLENRIACNETGQIVVDFTYRAAESLWPPYFRKYLTSTLSASFAMSIARNESMADGYKKDADLNFRRAKLADSQQQTTRRLRKAGLVSVRS